MFSKKAVPDKRLYDIIPSQNAMYLMHKVSLHKQQTQIPTSFTVDRELDFALLQKAFLIEIERNDCLRLRFIKTKAGIKQYFGDSYTYDVPVMNFSSPEEQQEFFDKDAPLPVRFMKGEMFRIYFYRTKGCGCGIYTNFSHMIMDAAGIVIFYLDLLKVYDALEKVADMPAPLHRYEDYIVKKLEEAADEKKTQKHEAFYREYFSRGGAPFYAGAHGSELLDSFRKKKKDPSARVPMAYNPLHDRCDMEIYHISKEELDKIAGFCMSNQISPENVFQLGLRTYCSAINYRTDDVCMMSVCSNRTNYKEKNMSGCMAQPLIFRSIISEESTFLGAAEVLGATRMQLYRHSLYPYTKARDMFLEMHKLGPIQGANNMMFSWIPLPEGADLPFGVDFRTYNLGRYFTPLYTIVTPDTKTGGINVYYMYRTKLFTKEKIERLHKNMMNIILTGAKNPEITIAELLNSVK